MDCQAMCRRPRAPRGRPCWGASRMAEQPASVPGSMRSRAANLRAVARRDRIGQRFKFFRTLPKDRGMALILLSAVLLPALLLLVTGCRSARTDRGTLRFLIESSPNNLDLRQGTDAQSERIGALIYEGLARRDERFALQPSLAAWWEQPNPLTWVF